MCDFFVYLCDPDKHYLCKKTGCQKECFHTLHREFSKDGKKYRYNDYSHNYEVVERSDDLSIR